MHEHLINPRIERHGQDFKYSIEYKMYMTIIHDPRIYQYLRKKYRVIEVLKDKKKPKRQRVHNDRYFHKMSRNRIISSRDVSKSYRNYKRLSKAKADHLSLSKKLDKDSVKRIANQNLSMSGKSILLSPNSNLMTNKAMTKRSPTSKMSM